MTKSESCHDRTNRGLAKSERYVKSTFDVDDYENFGFHLQSDLRNSKKCWVYIPTMI